MSSTTKSQGTKTRVNIRVDGVLWSWVGRFADRRRMTKTAVVEEGLRMVMDSVGDGEEVPQFHELDVDD